MNNEDMILLEYDPFAMESRICVIKDGNREYTHTESEIEALASTLVSLAYESGIYQIKTYAPFAVSSEIRKLATQIESTTYSTNKINIEGI